MYVAQSHTDLDQRIGVTLKLTQLKFTSAECSIFKLHRMNEMQTIVTDDRDVCQSVCHAAQLGFVVQKRLNASRCCLG